METIFGYFFLTIIVFAALTGIIGLVYMLLLFDYMSAKCPLEYQKAVKHFKPYWLPIKTWKWLKEVRASGDDKMNSMSRKALFWFWCSASIWITAPVGIVVFLILKATNNN